MLILDVSHLLHEVAFARSNNSNKLDSCSLACNFRFTKLRTSKIAQALFSHFLFNQ